MRYEEAKSRILEKKLTGVVWVADVVSVMFHSSGVSSVWGAHGITLRNFLAALFSFRLASNDICNLEPSVKSTMSWRYLCGCMHQLSFEINHALSLASDPTTEPGESSSQES